MKRLPQQYALYAQCEELVKDKRQRCGSGVDHSRQARLVKTGTKGIYVFIYLSTKGSNSAAQRLQGLQLTQPAFWTPRNSIVVGDCCAGHVMLDPPQSVCVVVVCGLRVTTATAFYDCLA